MMVVSLETLIYHVLSREIAKDRLSPDDGRARPEESAAS